MGSAKVDRRRRAVAGSLAVWGTLGLAGCGGGVTIVVSDEDDDGDEEVSISYEFVVGYDTRILPTGGYALRSQADLDRVWATSPTYPGGGVAGGAAPLFDFADFTLVVIALGVGLMCDQPRLVGVNASGSTLTVSWRTDRDGSLSCEREGLLQLLLAVPQWPGDVVFRRLD